MYRKNKPAILAVNRMQYNLEMNKEQFCLLSTLRLGLKETEEQICQFRSGPLFVKYERSKEVAVLNNLGAIKDQTCSAVISVVISYQTLAKRLFTNLNSE
jgi:hypothetical protein